MLPGFGKLCALPSMNMMGGADFPICTLRTPLS